MVSNVYSLKTHIVYVTINAIQLHKKRQTRSDTVMLLWRDVDRYTSKLPLYYVVFVVKCVFITTVRAIFSLLSVSIQIRTFSTSNFIKHTWLCLVMLISAALKHGQISNLTTDILPPNARTCYIFSSIYAHVLYMNLDEYKALHFEYNYKIQNTNKRIKLNC